MTFEQLNNLHLDSLYRYQRDDIEKLSDILYESFGIDGHKFLLGVFALLERQQRINEELMKRLNDLEDSLRK